MFIYFEPTIFAFKKTTQSPLDGGDAEGVIITVILKRSEESLVQNEDLFRFVMLNLFQHLFSSCHCEKIFDLIFKTWFDI